jgi:hypothetical protein
MSLETAEMNHRLVDLAEGPATRFWRVDFEVLSGPERVFRAVWELEGEVNNGGFSQYFFNSSGALAPFVVDALRSIGANQTAQLLERAVNVVGKQTDWQVDASRRARLQVLAGNAVAELTDLDHAFLRYPEDLTALLYNYAWTHREEIGGAGDILISPD